jgi:hypothetical protein
MVEDPSGERVGNEPADTYDPAIQGFGNAVDRLLSVDFPARGTLDGLYPAARAANGDRPVMLTAANRLNRLLTKHSFVVIATGIPVLGWFDPALGENDGPAGAATLARALFVASGAIPVIVCERGSVPMLEACCRAAGMVCTTLDAIRAASTSPRWSGGQAIPVTVVRSFPEDPREAATEAASLVADLKPAAMITLERQGANSKGVYHSPQGDITVPNNIMAKVDILFQEGQKNGVFTVGIGDGGNELGMGTIRQFIQDNILYGKTCRCPCASGFAPEFAADVLVAVTISNWGAWGIEACLAMLTGKPAVLHNLTVERSVMDACVAAGALHGHTGLVEKDCDLVSHEMNLQILDVLHGLMNIHRSVLEGRAPTNFGRPPLV